MSRKIPQERSGRPARKYLKNVSSLFANKWYNIGLELLDPEDESKLDAIQSNKAGNVSDCCGDMLHFWLQKQPYATWNQLIDALRSPGIELFDVASKIEGMLNEPPLIQASQQPLQSSPVCFSPNENILIAFTKLSAAVTTAIKNTNFPVLQRAGLETARSPYMALKSHEIVPIFKEARSFDILCTSLADSPYWNFLDTRILEAMATASMIPAAQESVENFKKAYFGMTLSEAAPYFPVCVRTKPGHTIMREVLDEDPNKMTIGDLHKHRFFIEMEITEKPDSCTISRIVIGSVTIEWQIHVDHVYQVYSAFDSKLSRVNRQSVTDLSVPEVVRWAGLPILWRGQEVTHIGPFDDLTEQLSYSLPKGLEWTTLCANNIDEIVELYDSTNKTIYKNTILWNFKHSYCREEFVFGVRESSSRKLVLAMWCVPYYISIKGQSLPVVELLQSEYNASYKSNELYNVVTKEAMRRVYQFGIFQSVLVLSIPQIIRPTITLNFWMYNFLRSSHPLPYNSPRTAGLRRMVSKDIPRTLALINQKMHRFEIGQVFQTEKGLMHYCLCPSNPGYIISYVVEDPVDGNITDMFAFILPTFDNVEYNKKMGKCAVVSVIVNTKSSTRQLITDLLLCAKQEQVDVLSTQQFGLAKYNFENLLVHYYEYGYWHLYNYSYPELDDESCCVFNYSSLIIGINKQVFGPGFVAKNMNQQLKEMDQSKATEASKLPKEESDKSQSECSTTDGFTTDKAADVSGQKELDKTRAVDSYDESKYHQDLQTHFQELAVSTISSSPQASDAVEDKIDAINNTATSTVSTSSSFSHWQFKETDLIRIKGKEDLGKGVVRWIGSLPGIDEPVAGIEHNSIWPGGNDGTWEEKSYFKCPMGHGLFMPFSKIMKDPLYDYFLDSGYESMTSCSSSSSPEESFNLDYDFDGSEHFFLSHEMLRIADVFSDDDGILKVTFPGDCTGLIIGNEGNTIIDIQNESHTTIKVHQNCSDLTANGVAWIMGSKKNCEDALMLMCKKLNEKICRLHAIKETITIPDSSVGRVIGTEGSVKKAIEKLSGVKMKFEVEKDMMLNLLATESKFTIQGSEEQIERAKQLIEMAVQGENIVMLQNVLKEVLQVMNAMGFELL